MNIKRYFGKNSRDALNMVRQELGADAVILSNRAVAGGNEILAFREEDMAKLVASNDPKPKSPTKQPLPPVTHHAEPAPETLVSMLSRSKRVLKTAEPLNHAELKAQRADNRTPVAPQPQPANRMQAPAMVKPVVKHEAKAVGVPAVDTKHAQNGFSSMMKEMRSMRSTIESQLTEMAWGNIQQRNPAKSSVLQSMIAAGFSAGLSRQIAENTPAQHTEVEAMKWLQTVISKNLNTINDEQQILDEGGIFALVGPTGVGKTTTTAKLAARFVMKHGAKKLALITTDSYRIGGHEQLRIYGKILGVMVHAVKDEADLKLALNELKGKHTILIDTVGVSQRDRMVAEQITMLSNTGMPIKKILCMNATSTGETLTDVIEAYKSRGLDGCIITKLDEAATIGSVLDVIIREKLRLYYVANGQRVPEDIHLANKSLLVHHAFKIARKKTDHFRFRDEEIPFIMANMTADTSTSGLVGMKHD
ncbi:flagellar biosynthesis protein FlhF [Methylobacillus gramineus]|uniref:flagellar biosynthesis protein FlhF n=1 Tax=Methylobacillus gramineus TaxID=755169 RepID=UPI001D001162|nr:flagellar biosynthesis protein FlhF [Methylobacillus gramineus]MCB5183794.1 flagellar biosynthesis protein FlhF [Methylobacillus gramineus]